MRLSALAVLALAAAPLQAQMSMMDHDGHDGPLPKQPAQAAYASIAEIVRILKADSTTDWSKVNLEAVRQHVIDMDAVTMRAAVSQKPVPGGVTMTVTGDAKVSASIKRMVTSHAGMLDQDPQYHATVTPIANGVQFTVTSRDASNLKLVAMIRGEGFAGLLTEGDHHARHHMALARGDAMAHMH
jgi:hypothetical protein